MIRCLQQGQADGAMANTEENIASTMTSALTNASARAQAELYDAVFVQKKLLSASLKRPLSTALQAGSSPAGLPVLTLPVLTVS